MNKNDNVRKDDAVTEAAGKVGDSAQKSAMRRRRPPTGEKK
jgi:hypothetical protein